MCRYLVAGAAALVMVIASPTAGQSNPHPEEAVERAPVAVQRLAPAASGLRDEASMVLVGTGLLVLAAAVRRSA